MKLTNIIFEGKQVGKIYHYTTPGNWEKIKESNTLQAGDPLGDYTTTPPRKLHPPDLADQASISFTRNKNLHSTDYWYDLGLVITSVKDMIRLTLDGDKLSQNYKLKPFRYAFTRPRIHPGAVADEYETRALTPKITDLNKYLIAVDLVHPSPSDKNSETY